MADQWYVLLRDDPDEIWNAVLGLSKAAAHAVQATYIAKEFEVVVGFGSPGFCTCEPREGHHAD